jgi:Uma2 family endonuclease
MSTAAKMLLTEEAFYEFEERSTERHQFYRGEIFSMAGASPEHVAIAFNLTGLLHGALTGQNCRGFTNDMLVYCPTGLTTYPDLGIVCDEPRYHAGRKGLVNPRLLVEILSESTELFDRTKKFDHYQSIPSFQDYVLVSQSAPRIEHYRRVEDGTWRLKIFAGRSETLLLEEYGIRFAFADIYERVEFSPPPLPQPDIEPGA